MADADRRALATEESLFLPRLRLPDRLWTVDRVITHTGPDDAAVRAMLGKVRTLGMGRIKIPPGTAALARFDEARRLPARASIVNGAIVAHLDVFVDRPETLPLLDFTINRRFRSVARMVGDVNKGRALRYPNQADEGHPVPSAEAEWTTTPGKRRVYPLGYPLTMSVVGLNDPVVAIKQLVTPKKDPKLRTICDCPLAATMVHLDALGVAADPAVLYSALHAEGIRYLAIDHPYGPFTPRSNEGGIVSTLTTAVAPGANVDAEVTSVGALFVLGLGSLAAPKDLEVTLYDEDGPVDLVLSQGAKAQDPPFGIVTIKNVPRPLRANARIIARTDGPYHAVCDRRPTSLFEQISLPVADGRIDDLQVGDNVYVMNHPFHQGVIPVTVWNGEYAFVTSAGSRAIRQLWVSGHGVTNKSVIALVKDMYLEIDRFLNAARSVVQRHREMPRPVAAEFAVTDVNKQLVRDELFKNTPSLNGWTFKGMMREYTYPGVVFRTRLAKVQETFVVATLDGTIESAHGRPPQAITPDQMLVVHYVRRHLNGDLRRQNVLIWHGGNPAMPEPVDYSINYYDVLQDREAWMTLWSIEGGAIIPTTIWPVNARGVPVRDDPDAAIIIYDAQPDFALITRPRVDGSPAYLARLRAVGAIP